MASKVTFVGFRAVIAHCPPLDPPLQRRHIQREREREFIGTNIKQFHAKIELRRWDTEKTCKTGCLVRRPSKVS